MEKYSIERRSYAMMISNLAMKYYKRSLDIPRDFGLSVDNLLFFKNSLDLFSPVIPT